MITLEQALLDLGTTTPEVSIKLRSLHIKGYRSICCSCPIAKYFMKVCGFVWCEVKGTGISYKPTFNVRRAETSPTPEVIKQWIRQFDNGFWLEFAFE